ncbi:MAG: aminotransferase [Gammaproteobacteria bacterium CG11_big_fil_rev_8_21_14_0_20_46_22]|nr:MAG: aminotransferase [Gammaproteobacteria bacterium CG12_big_fil_rev_8_21_14_0_65_46_12]PIR12134.1 MAG: aminotransferase [Gammaproteobacteria bacterium CG11_big_fil_rev_8_21_14_0_20_46_22]
MSNWPHFADDEIQAVVDVLKSGKVNQWTGTKVREFEQTFAESHGCQYGIALANGTLALELALYALGIGPGDDVITTAKTFVASASCVVMRGARPIIADVDLDSQNITAETIEAAMTPNTKAIIAVHMAGWPCDMDAIMALAKKHNLYVIEDCAQAHGARYKGRPVGSLGHVAAFSFCQDKIMTTGGEGGMLTTNDEALWKKAWAYKDHGKDYDLCFNTEHPPGFRWLHTDFGTNWRMTEMQAAIGLKQLEKLPAWHEARKRNAAILSEALARLPFLRVALPSDEIEHAWYKYYVFVILEKLPKGISRDDLINALAVAGLPAMTGGCSEIYHETCFKKYGYGPKADLPNARKLTETSMLFLIHPTLSADEMEKMADNICQILLQCAG